MTNGKRFEPRFISIWSLLLQACKLQQVRETGMIRPERRWPVELEGYLGVPFQEV
jgi:hypothetical protein